MLAGFFSLEEIDEAEYGLDIPDPEDDNRKQKSKQSKKLKKQKQHEVDGAPSDMLKAEFNGETVKDESMKSKVKKKKKKKKKAAKENKEVEQPNTGDCLFSFK